MKDQELKAITRKIDDLINLCEQLEAENRLLKANASSWATERDQLVDKTELARSKVESMIIRLKAMEQES
jgi:cell division protein ZapB